MAVNIAEWRSVMRVRSMVSALAILAMAPLFSPRNMFGQQSASKPATKSVATTRATPDPALIDLAGYNKQLAKYKGKPLLVTFWATWCEPCRDEFPMLVSLTEEYAPKGLAVFGVSLDNNADMNLVRHFLAQYRPGFPNYRQDPQIDVDAFYHGVNPQWQGAMPETIFYGRDGRIALSFIAEQPRAIYEQAIRTILGSSASGKSESAHPPAGN
jgi:thiol-disulfide isomerase/thioredoxin